MDGPCGRRCADRILRLSRFRRCANAVAMSILLCAGVPVGHSRAVADDVVLTDDAYTVANRPDNTGHKTRLEIIAGGVEVDSFVKFSMSTLPPGTIGSDVLYAQLTVFVTKVKADGTIDVYQVTSAWNESTI